MSYTEQLYTARGSQAVGATKKDADEMIHNIQNFTQTLLLQNNNINNINNLYYDRRVLWTFDHLPDYTTSKHTGFISIPSML